MSSDLLLKLASRVEAAVDWYLKPHLEGSSSEVEREVQERGFVEEENDELEDDVNMVDVPPESSLSFPPPASRGRGRPRGSKKRKNVSPAPHGRVKRRTRELQEHSNTTSKHLGLLIPVAPGSYRALNDNPGSGSSIRDVNFVCDRCARKKQPCTPTPTGACIECRGTKQSCSLVVHRPSGAPIRSNMSSDEVLNYRLNQLSKKGEEPACNPPEEEDQPVSMGLDPPSLSSALAPSLRELILSNNLLGQAPTKSLPFKELQGSNSCSISELATTSAHRPAVAGPSTVNVPACPEPSVCPRCQLIRLIKVIPHTINCHGDPDSFA